MRRSLRHSLASELRARIRSGEWRPGERIPSEPELARRRTVSRSSMRAAITVLEEEGYVNRKHGSGTYVTHRPALRNDLGRNFGVSTQIASTGSEPGAVDVRSGLEPAPEFVAEALGLEAGDPVSTLRRVRTRGHQRAVRLERLGTGALRADVDADDERGSQCSSSPASPGPRRSSVNENASARWCSRETSTATPPAVRST